MADTTAEVVIIGAGVVGAAIAYHLAARGCTDVLLLERSPDITDSSTARSAAGVRHQWSSAINIRLSQLSIAQLRRFPDELGVESGLRLVGYLFLVREPDTWAAYQRGAALQQAYGVPTQLLTPEQAAGFFPGTRTDDLQGATFCDQDGYCDPLAIRNGYLQRALDSGVRLWPAAPATAIATAGGRAVSVRTVQGAVSCGTLVNAAGSWAGAVGALAQLDIPVQPIRRQMFALETPRPLAHDIPFSFDVDSGFYMRSAGQQLWCGKINPADQPGHNLTLDWDWLPQVLAAGQARFPALADWTVNRARSWPGSYEITPDHAPILGRHPALPNYLDASGFSGHGVMHAPATGLLIAEEILDGRAHTIDIAELRIVRFQQQQAAAERNVF